VLRDMPIGVVKVGESADNDCLRREVRVGSITERIRRLRDDFGHFVTWDKTLRCMR